MTSEFVGTVPPKKHTKTIKRFIVDVVVVVAPTMGYTFLTYRNSITKQNAHVTNRRLLCGPSGQAGTMPVSSAITVAAPGRSGGLPPRPGRARGYRPGDPDGPLPRPHGAPHRVYYAVTQSGAPWELHWTNGLHVERWATL